ncbi:MAG: hypothetical protein WCL39_04115, partial [Armatimonadota bacterium]
MEVGQSLKFLRIAVWAAPLLALAWALIAGALDKTQQKERQPVAPFVVFTLVALGGVVVLAFALNALLSSTDKSLIIWLNTLVGGAIVMAGIAIIGHFRRSDESDGAESVPWGQANSAIAAVALAVLLGAYLITKHGARADEWLTAAGMGAAMVAGLFSLAAQSNRPGSQGALLPIRVTLPVELLAAACCAVTLAIVCGRLMSFGEVTLKHAGDSVSIYLAIALLVWVPLSVAQRVMLHSSRVAAVLLAVIYTLLAGWLGHLSSAVNFLPVSASQCLWTGLGAGLILAVIHSGGLFHKVSGYDRQASVIAMIVVVCATAMCLRLLTGFGVIVCAAGVLAAVPAWALLTPWRTRDDGVSLPFPTPLAWASAFLVGVTAMRVWLSWSDTNRISIDSPYVILGMVIGMGLPFVLWSLIAGSREDTLSPGGTGPSAFGSLIGVVLIVCAIAGVSMVLREPAVRVFLLGLAAANIVGAVVLSGAREDWTSAPVVSLSLLASLMTLTGSQAIATFTQEVARPDKVKALLILFAIALVLYLVLEVWRTLAIRHKTTVIIERVDG